MKTSSSTKKPQLRYTATFALLVGLMAVTGVSAHDTSQPQTYYPQGIEQMWVNTNHLSMEQCIEESKRSIKGLLVGVREVRADKPVQVRNTVEADVSRGRGKVVISCNNINGQKFTHVLVSYSDNGRLGAFTYKQILLLLVSKFRAKE